MTDIAQSYANLAAYCERRAARYREAGMVGHAAKMDAAAAHWRKMAEGENQ